MNTLSSRNRINVSVLSYLYELAKCKRILKPLSQQYFTLNPHVEEVQPPAGSVDYFSGRNHSLCNTRIIVLYSTQWDWNKMHFHMYHHNRRMRESFMSRFDRDLLHTKSSSSLRLVVLLKNSDTYNMQKEFYSFSYTEYILFCNTIFIKLMLLWKLPHWRPDWWAH